MPKFIANQNARLNQAIVFATMAHGNQVRKGNEHVPYIFHPIDVANEVIYYSGLLTELIEPAALVAILHDTVEDTHVTVAMIAEQFGHDIADGVAALSKDESIETTHKCKRAELEENLVRLRAAPTWVQCVKLADRNSNLKSFPAMWDREKIGHYLDEAELIAERLGDASRTLKARLLGRVAEARMVLSIVK